MSQIMEKTLASLPKLLSQSFVGGGNASKAPERRSPSMDVQHFMKQIHKAQSRSQEAAIVKSHLSLTNQKLKGADLVSSPSLVRASFTKIIFCYQLGYDVKEMAIHAIKLAQQGRGFDKRLGYLLSCLLLNPQHEVTILMTGTILSDLRHSDMTANCLALRVAGELVSVETIPFLLPEVISKLSHQQDLVKEKALHCFRCFYEKAPELLERDIPRLNAFLTSRDPGVLMAVLNIFLPLTSQKPSLYVSLSPGFIHILEQINSRGFGSVYYYHMVALPWLQISLLKVLCNLAQIDSNTCARMEPILKTLIERTKVSEPISLALLVESIQTATKISASESLLQLCSRCIMKLMSSDSSGDMRYQGLGLLISLSKVKPSYASQHQAAVMECLSSNDPAIQSRTTFLLYAMANTANVKVICDKLFEQLEKSSDRGFCNEISEMIMNLLEKFMPDIEWYVNTHFRHLSFDQDNVLRDRVVNSLLERIEQFHHANEVLDQSGLNNVLETTLSYLEQELCSKQEFVVRIQLLGVLIPLIPHHLQVERFFNSVSPRIFDAAFCDANAKLNNTMMHPPGHFNYNGGQSEPYGLLNDREDVRLKVTCVEIILKLVLAQCLSPQAVAQWLEKNDFRNKNLNGFVRGVLLELEDLVRHPSNLGVKSEIVFGTQIAELDLSLSFLDSLVVRDLLKGGDCYKPKFIRDCERSSHDLSVSVSTPPERGSFDDDGKDPSLPSLTDSVPETMKKDEPPRKIKGRWHDDDGVDSGDVSEDDEQFLFVDTGTSISTQADRSNKELAEQLFAGLDGSNSSGPTFSPSDSGVSSSGAKGVMKSPRNIWDDDDDAPDHDKDRKSTFFGMDFHPFGISKKASPKSLIWRDDESMDNADMVMDQTSGPSLHNNPQEASLYTPTYLYHQDNADSIDQSVIMDGLSSEQETGLSIYSEFGDGQSSLLASPDVAVSTVDTLTDSDPEGN